MQFVPSPFPRSCATATVAAQGRVLSAEMASKMSGGQALQGATSKAGGPTSAPRQLHPRSAGKLAQCKAVQNLSTQAVNTLKQLNVEAPDVADIKIRDVKATSYVSRRRMAEATFDPNAVDEEGLPLVYNEQKINSFWAQRPGELVGRWANFTAVSAPWLTKLANAVISGRFTQEATQAELAADAVNNLERLGPTFIKLGQVLSIRPDVLPPPVMKELAKLQDRIAPFSCTEAKAVVAKELGRPVDEVFSEWSDKPIAAASLAQVYKARLRSTGESVAVKVQRPGALATISKDLYVMRRAVGVYEQIVKRFTAQTTDYQALLSTFAEGLYTELDFQNEALNALRMRELLDASEFSAAEVVIPQPKLELTTRRVLVMDWITGVKLTTLPPDEIRALVKVGQAAFLTQLLEIGCMHGDPHPGNLLKVTEGPHAGKLALLDFGLVAEIPREDREAMVSATIHLANKDWDALIDDFIALGFLPRDADRGLIIPVMDRVLSPYLRGGGARSFNFQALSQDLLATTLEIPFSVPPYMSLLARAVATLEGIALAGDPQYQMVAQAYPFVVRKVLRNQSDASSALLRDILYDPDGKVKTTRLSALLNAGLGYVADSRSSQGFIDFDAVPAEGASISEVVSFLLGPEARELRPLLVDQLAGAADLFLRDRVRRAYARLPTLAPRLPFIGALLPPPPPPPIFVPGIGLLPAEQAVELLAPALIQGEEVYLASLTELAAGLLGVSVGELESPSLDRVLRLVTSPTEQVKELGDALAAISGSTANTAAARQMAVEVVEVLAARQADRAGVPVDTLFGPALTVARRVIENIGTQRPTQPQTTAPAAPVASPATPGSSHDASAAAAASTATTSSSNGRVSEHAVPSSSAIVNVAVAADQHHHQAQTSATPAAVAAATSEYLQRSTAAAPGPLESTDGVGSQGGIAEGSTAGSEGSIGKAPLTTPPRETVVV